MFVQNIHVIMSKWLQFKPVETLFAIRMINLL